jgi:hypothetical protein
MDRHRRVEYAELYYTGRDAALYNIKGLQTSTTVRVCKTLSHQRVCMTP